MMKTLKDLRYSKEHEWVKLEGGKAYIGITDYAQHALGDIVFVELPKTGSNLNTGDIIGVVESVKAASDIYTPISGTVADINKDLEVSPEKINESPYDCWIAALEINDANEYEGLMDAVEYEKFCEQEG